MSEQLYLFDPPAPVGVLGESWGYFWSTSRGQDVKHGMTDELKRRKGQLQTGNPDDLILMGAYPHYSKNLELAVHDHFSELRKPDTEWFTAKTIEFKIVALGDGLPVEILEGITELTDARRELVDSVPRPSPAAKLSYLSMTWTDKRWLREQQTRLIGHAMMALAGSMDEWRARQPLEVQINQLWQLRLSGEQPFDFSAATLQPSRILELLHEFRRLGSVVA